MLRGTRKLKFFIIMAIGLTSSLAEARRQSRDGFNFGAGFQLMNADDRGYAQTENDSDSKVTHSRNGFQPHGGVVFADHFNLGISGLFETESNVEVETNALSGSETRRERLVSTQGMSIFARFLFGRVMFIESGFGLYRQKSTVSSESKLEIGLGSFEGARSSTTQSGLGTGYHVAGGIEIPISYGFFSTVSYASRVFNIRDSSGTSEIGSKLGLYERREVVFGLSHYVK